MSNVQRSASSARPQRGNKVLITFSVGCAASPLNSTDWSFNLDWQSTKHEEEVLHLAGKKLLFSSGGPMRHFRWLVVGWMFGCRSNAVISHAPKWAQQGKMYCNFIECETTWNQSFINLLLSYCAVGCLEAPPPSGPRAAAFRVCCKLPWLCGEDEETAGSRINKYNKGRWRT